MKVVTRELRFETRGGEIDLIDITREVERIVEESGVENGQALVFVPGATGGHSHDRARVGPSGGFQANLKGARPEG